MPETPKSSLEEEMEMMISEKHRKALEFIEDVTREADQVQKRVLAEILTRNAHVEYLKRFGVDGRADSESFKRLLPVVSYEDLQPYMDRIAHGDKSPILCSDPITEFLTSSGTSGGEMKLMPMIEEEMERRSHLNSLLMPVMNQFVPGLDKGKGMYFLFVRAEITTPGGVLTRPVLTSFYKSRHFKNRAYDPFNTYTSPDDTILCPDSYQSMYSQLLCGLLQHKDVIRMGAVFASGFIRAIKFLEKNWPSLCKDIRTGILNTQITDPSVIQAVMKLLKPNPELADFVEKECGRETWEGIIIRLWPNTKYIDVTVTGTMTQYINTLDYYSNGLPLVCSFYGSSECYFGLNLEPLSKPSEVSYTLIPTMGYFEFLPLHTDSDSVNEKEQQELLDLVDVKLGQEYEIVVTTYAGLYRYKVGDILRVSGFKNKAPTFNFVSRKNVVLSIDIDKTDEVELQDAVKNAVRHLDPFEASLLEYTSFVDTSTIPGHYVLYWELRTGPTSIPPSVFENCCLTIEESLSGVYRQGRVSEKTIGPLEIKIVETGTFEKLMDYALSRGASVSQYKTPLSVKFEPIVEMLNSKVVANHFSPKFPSWLPGLKQWTS